MSERFPLLCKTYRAFPNGEPLFITATSSTFRREPLAVWRHITAQLGNEDAPSVKTIHLSCEWVAIDVYVLEGEDVDELRGRATAWLDAAVSSTPDEW